MGWGRVWGLAGGGGHRLPSPSAHAAPCPGPGPNLKPSYTEDYSGDGSDSCGIHASGAGFQRSDKIEKWVPPSY